LLRWNFKTEREFTVQVTRSSVSTTIRWAGIIAIFAALLGVIADLALQYTTNTAHLLSDQSLYLLDVPPSRLLVGHYLGVVAIFMEIAGFWQIYRAIQPAGEHIALPFFLSALLVPCSARLITLRSSLSD
jgi:hypothetical protein